MGKILSTTVAEKMQDRVVVDASTDDVAVPQSDELVREIKRMLTEQDAVLVADRKSTRLNSSH